jgi:ADP-ribose pyrophosphatase YjhB (NUDIX family)
MYKVFLNDRVIKIDAPGNIAVNKSFFQFQNSVSADEIKNWLPGFFANHLKEVFLLHPDPEFFFNLFRQLFLEVSAAGGVMVSESHLLFIFRNGKWDLPKGKAGKGERPEETAIREVKEETGIQADKIVKRLPSTFHLYLSPHHQKEQWILKETNWFEMSCEGKPAGNPQHEEGITMLKWVAKTNLNEILSNTYENLKQIIILYLD